MKQSKRTDVQKVVALVAFGAVAAIAASPSARAADPEPLKDQQQCEQTCLRCAGDCDRKSGAARDQCRASCHATGASCCESLGMKKSASGCFCV